MKAQELIKLLQSAIKTSPKGEEAEIYLWTGNGCTFDVEGPSRNDVRNCINGNGDIGLHIIEKD